MMTVEDITVGWQEMLTLLHAVSNALKKTKPQRIGSGGQLLTDGPYSGSLVCL